MLKDNDLSKEGTIKKVPINFINIVEEVTYTRVQTPAAYHYFDSESNTLEFDIYHV